MSVRRDMRYRGGRILQHSLLVAVTLNAMVPLYFMVSGAFKTQEDFYAEPFLPPLDPTLQGFETAIRAEYPTWFLNSVLVTGATVTLTVGLASLAAWGFVNWDFRGRQPLFNLLISLMVVPPVVLLVPLFVLGVRLDMISTFRLVVLIYVGLALPFSIYLLTSFFKTIPRPLVESALVDGASPWAVFRRIVLPLSRAPLVTLGVVNLFWVWNELLIALVFLQDDGKRTLMVGITAFQSRYTEDIPAIMAGITLATLPIVTIYLFAQRLFMRGLTAGALKGE